MGLFAAVVPEVDRRVIELGDPWPHKLGEVLSLLEDTFRYAFAHALQLVKREFDKQVSGNKVLVMDIPDNGLQEFIDSNSKQKSSELLRVSMENLWPAMGGKSMAFVLDELQVYG